MTNVLTGCIIPVTIISGEVRRDAELSAVTDFLSRNVASPLTLSQIALGCSMSVSKLKIIFREKAHIGPINYLIRLRIEEAQRLMRESDLTLTQIAERVGFASLHNFSRMFKKITGVSPSQYEKQQ